MQKRDGEEQKQESKRGLKESKRNGKGGSETVEDNASERKKTRREKGRSERCSYREQQIEAKQEVERGRYGGGGKENGTEGGRRERGTTNLIYLVDFAFLDLGPFRAVLDEFPETYLTRSST